MPKQVVAEAAIETESLPKVNAHRRGARKLLF